VVVVVVIRLAQILPEESSLLLIVYQMWVTLTENFPTIWVKELASDSFIKPTENKRLTKKLELSKVNRLPAPMKT